MIKDFSINMNDTYNELCEKIVDSKWADNYEIGSNYINIRNIRIEFNRQRIKGIKIDDCVMADIELVVVTDDNVVESKNLLYYTDVMLDYYKGVWLDFSNYGMKIGVIDEYNSYNIDINIRR
jgi:hypothetical protein